MLKITECLRRKWETIGLKLIAKKIQHMKINSNKTVISIECELLKNIDNLFSLGNEIESTDKEIKIRIAKSWATL